MPVRPEALRTREDLRSLLGVTRDLTLSATADEGGRERDGDVLRSRLVLRVGDRRVPCLVLRPVTGGPWPGVVAVHQHDGDFALGKSEPAGLVGDPAMAYGLAAARAGTVVVIPDLAGFEERARPGLEGSVGERLEALRLLTEGSTLQARHVEDVAMCVSWLAADREVRGGLGVMGHSLGGQVAFFALACDPRLRAAVLSCGLGTLRSFDRAGVLHNSAWYVPALVALGDTPAVAALCLGQSVRVTAGEGDHLFPLDGVHDAVAGFPPGAAGLHLHPGGHGLPDDERAAAVAWLVSALTG